MESELLVNMQPLLMGILTAVVLATWRDSKKSATAQLQAHESRLRTLEMTVAQWQGADIHRQLESIRQDIKELREDMKR